MATSFADRSHGRRTEAQARQGRAVAAGGGVVAHEGVVRWGLLAGVAAALTWSYWPVLRDLVTFWRENSDYSAGALVPIVAGYVVWSHRRDLAAMPMRACWWGLAALLGAQAVRYYGTFDMYGSLERYSLVLTIAALTLLLVGWRITWRLKWVLLFLLLMAPLPGRVHNAVALPLQDFASRSAVIGLEMLGYLVGRDGNVLRLSDQTSVFVAEACSGLRMLTAFVIVGAAMAFVVKRPLWQKAIVVVSTVPVAIVANTLRLIVTVLLFEQVGSEAGERFLHDFAGLVMMPFAWAILAAEVLLMRWLTAEPAEQGAAKGAKPIRLSRRKLAKA